MKTLTHQNVHTSESLKAQDTKFENFHYQLDDGERYALTDGEQDWLYNWVRGKYVIADHLIENIQCDEDEEGNDVYVYTVDTIGLGKALTDDQCFPKAVMLSDDSALQAIMFYSACEPITDE
tara:strand:+ start:3196 stop:3561 length:366 start_codon:yes stop_codon:yes gene_type:complete